MEHTITHQELESLKALSEANLKISEARNTLFRLKEEETEYLVERERQAMERVEATLKASESLVAEADKNYALVLQLVAQVTDFADKLEKTQQEVEGLASEVEQQAAALKEREEKLMADLQKQNKGIEITKKLLENRQKAIENDLKKLEKERIKIADDRGVIKRTIERLKKGKI
jgi:ABC-type transporter Mla subunit MlaD